MLSSLDSNVGEGGGRDVQESGGRGYNGKMGGRGGTEKHREENIRDSRGTA